MAALRTIICGSPRRKGGSARIAQGLEALLREAYPDDQILTVHVGESNIAPCIGCDRCRATGRCFMRDDMDRVMQALDGSVELFVASPVYFAGPPAQYKALLDRLQPCYWTRARTQSKRPACLIVLGEGGDPHGFGPLEVCTRSALACAGFQLRDVFPCIGVDCDLDAFLSNIRANLLGGGVR
jgi:multimeric flavodoxin WrbA